MPPYILPAAVPLVGSTQVGIVAAAGGGYQNATQLTARYNRVGTVATAADSVKLPPLLNVMLVSVANDGAAALAVFPYTVTDQISNGSAGASVSIPVGKTAEFIGTGASPNQWTYVVSA